MRNKREFFAAICIAGGMAWSAAIAGDVTVGWRSAASRAVADGEAATFSDRLTVGDGGVFCKLGAGTLTLPLSQVDRQRPYAVDALEGTLALAPGAASADATPPTFIASKAAFWVDATPGNGLQTEDDDGTTRVTRWCDVREADPANRAYPSALPGIVATGAANAQTDNPVVTNVYGNAAVYFGGLGSGQYMAFKTAADAALSTPAPAASASTRIVSPPTRILPPGISTFGAATSTAASGRPGSRSTARRSICSRRIRAGASSCFPARSATTSSRTTTSSASVPWSRPSAAISFRRRSSSRTS